MVRKRRDVVAGRLMVFLLRRGLMEAGVLSKKATCDGTRMLPAAKIQNGWAKMDLIGPWLGRSLSVSGRVRNNG